MGGEDSYETRELGRGGPEEVGEEMGQEVETQNRGVGVPEREKMMKGGRARELGRTQQGH